MNCKEGIDSYTCGRAILPLTFNEGLESKIIVSNTISDDNHTIDTDYILSLDSDDKLIKGEKGKNFYYKKYLKYKSKYLKLKSIKQNP